MFWQLTSTWIWSAPVEGGKKRRSQSASGHIPALDAVRGMAILMVTLYRFGGGTHGPARALDPTWIVQLGSRGVDLFFVLSGFLITGILYDAKLKSHYFRNFYMRRALRIFPLYYCVVAAVVLAGFLVPVHETTFQQAIDHQGWLWFYGANVIQSLQGAWCLGPLDHFWSLAVEEHFYLMWPMLIFAVSRHTARRVCVGLIVGSAVGRLIFLACGGNDVTIDVLTPFRMDGLALGAWLALTARGGRELADLTRAARRALWVLTPVLLALSITHLRLMGIPHLLWSCFFAAFLVLVLTTKRTSWLGRAAHWPVLHFFGKYSYGMYVFQCLLIPLLGGLISAPALAEALGHPILGQTVYCAIMLAITVAVALLSWNLLEMRFLALKSYFGGHAPEGALSSR